MWKIIKAVALVVLIMLIATFAVENSGPASLNWYFVLENREVPLYILLYGFFAVGIFLGLALGGAQRIGLWKKNRELTREVKRLTEEGISTRVEAQHKPSKQAATIET